MAYIVPPEFKQSYLYTLDRVQAFEICGNGSDHIEFTQLLQRDVKLLYRCIGVCDVVGVRESLNKLNGALNERYMCYDHVTQMNILEFIRERRDIVEMMAIVNDMNEREQELKEILLCLVDDLDKRDNSILTKITSIDKGIKNVNKRLDKGGC